MRSQTDDPETSLPSQEMHLSSSSFFEVEVVLLREILLMHHEIRRSEIRPAPRRNLGTKTSTANAVRTGWISRQSDTIEGTSPIFIIFLWGVFQIMTKAFSHKAPSLTFENPSLPLLN
jgi:hypothetical protein